LRGAGRDVLIAGHFPHLPRLLTLLLTGETNGAATAFPTHGAVALESDDDGETWRELWRLDPGRDSGFGIRDSQSRD